MEILLHQRYSYAKITPFKNYSKFPRVVPSYNGLNNQVTYEDGSGFVTEYYDGDSGFPISPVYDEFKKKKTRFFYWDDEFKNAPIIKYASTHKLNGIPGEFYTTKDRHIKKYYNEPLSEISVHILERTITKKGEKITIKTNNFRKFRGFNCKYFRTNKYATSVTFDMVKGDFLIVDSSKHGKTKSGVRFRKNGFQQLHNFMDSSEGPFKFLKNHISKNNPLYNELKTNFKDKEFNQVLCKAFNINIKFPTDGLLFKTMFYDEVMRWFIDRKKIKIPNDYKRLLENYYPTEKYLKKNDRKLIASILDVFQIKSKVTIKLLHEKPNIDLNSLYMLCYLFGDNYQKYIGSINKDLFGTTSDMGQLSGISSLKLMEKQSHDLKNHGLDITDIEKENLLSVLTSQTERGVSVNENFMSLVNDHFKMLDRIRQYDPNIRMRANNRIKFHTEHNELSTIISAIKKGWVMQYFYPEKTIKEIQEPIEIEGVEKIIPHILTREEEYIEEGKFMHHCVASYAEKDTSMIVSLRTEDKLERVTCEFKIQNGNLTQSRYFSNAQPPPNFIDAIDYVSHIIRTHARFGTLNWNKKEKVPIKINGIEIPPEKREPVKFLGFDFDDGLQF